MSAPDLTIVIPAAGRSRRMRGQDKLLLAVDGVPLLGVVAARAVQVAPTRVVIAEDQADRKALLADHEVEVIEVASCGGMAASLQAGVADLSSAVMIVPADMPEVTAHDMAKLVALWRAGAAPILRAADSRGQPGHPVIFPAKLLPEFETLTGDTGAAPLLQRHAKQVGLMPIGPQAVLDLDTPEDWQSWQKGR